MRQRFAVARDRMTEGLRAAGFAVLDAAATYFLCVDLERSSIALDDESFATAAVEKAGVAVVPLVGLLQRTAYLALEREVRGPVRQRIVGVRGRLLPWRRRRSQRPTSANSGSSSVARASRVIASSRLRSSSCRNPRLYGASDWVGSTLIARRNSASASRRSPRINRSVPRFVYALASPGSNAIARRYAASAFTNVESSELSRSLRGRSRTPFERSVAQHGRVARARRRRVRSLLGNRGSSGQ